MGFLLVLLCGNSSGKYTINSFCSPSNVGMGVSVLCNSYKISCRLFKSILNNIYILVLIFLGGVIVLVVYITTLAANEKFIITVNYSRVMLIIGVGLRFILFLIKPIEISVTIFPVISMVAVLFDCSNITIYVFRILYLLVALVCVIKIIKLEKGPLVVRRLK